MKRVIIFQMILMLSIASGQNISISKDSLKYLHDVSNIYNPYTQFDSLLIYNTGDKILVIDSMINYNYTYNYLMKFCYKDSIEKSGYVGYYLQIFPSMNIFPLEIPSNDSAKFIFQYLLPISKTSIFYELKKDSILIYNNSVNQPTVQINIINDMPLSMEDDKTVPMVFELYQNYPNPFNPLTNIVFKLPRASYISINIFDALGRSIRKLLEKYMNAGKHEIIFDGQSLSSGVYFYQIKVDNNIFTKKMLLTK